MFLWKVRLGSRTLCLFLQDVRVESGGSCVLVESEAISQGAVFYRM